VSRRPAEDRGLTEQAVPGDLAARQRRGGERFQLRGDRGQTELLGDWDEDVQGLPGSAKLFRLRQIPDRLHVVQPVRQLHFDDPGVGRLRGRNRPRQLMSEPASAAVQGHDPGNHRRDSGAEFSAHRGERIRGVLHRVVQYRRAQGLVIRAEPGEDRRDADRVGDVGVAAAPELAPVTARRDIVGPQEELDVGIWPGGPEGLAC
jgi:hypothetical protein